MTLTEIRDTLAVRNCDPTGNGAHFEARCPAHADSRASLSVTEASDGKLLVHCHAGCTPENICAKLGLKLADLFPGTPKRNGGKAALVAAYDYRDESGNPLFQVCRFQPKDFRQRRPDAMQADGWLWKMDGVRRVLYRLPETLAAMVRGDVIHLAEGEKDVAALCQAGFAATCNPGGAGKWRPEYTATLKGASVLIVADKDAPGRKHAADVAGQLQAVAATVKVIELPDVAGKPAKDAADFFSAGGTADQLKALREKAPEWTAPTQPPPADTQAASIVPDLDKATADLRGRIVTALTNANCTLMQMRQIICDIALNFLSDEGQLYFHAERRDFDTAMFFNAREKRLLRIRSDAFSAWLSELLHINRADTFFKHVMAAVETAALSSTAASAILPAAYWQATAGAVYISDGDGRLVRVTARGLEKCDNGTDGILFAAGQTLKPWNVEAMPSDPFTTCRLFSDARTAAAHGRDLLRAWMYSLPTNPRCKPPLCLTGEIGSGKTRLAKGFAELYGVPFVAHKPEESGENEFWPACDQGGIFTLDNCDTRCRWLADAVAAAATDGCSQRRRLYTNADTVTLRARAWLCITSANPSFGNDSGLADRLLVVRTHRAADGESSDGALSDEIAANRDGALVHVAETLASALADSKPTPAGLNARHPDFASFAVRIGRALNREAATVAALQTAEADKSNFCLENDSIAAALLAYLATAGTFSGTAKELAPHLAAIDSDLVDRLSAKRLGKRLGALWPHLAKTLTVARRETGRGGFVTYTLKAPNGEYGEFETVFSINS